mgnify:CR=1 FL=1
MDKFNHYLDHSRQVIYREFKNLLNLEDIRESWNIILNTKEFVDDDYDLISDYRQVEMKINFRQIFEVLRFYSQNKDYIKGSNHAVITDSPRPAAFSTFFERNASLLFPINYKTFSSYDKAHAWLNKEPIE